jgi:hypothetical protein
LVPAGSHAPAAGGGRREQEDNAMFDQELQTIKDDLVALASDLLMRNRISSPVFKSFSTDINYAGSAFELQRIGESLSACSAGD